MKNEFIRLETQPLAYYIKINDKNKSLDLYLDKIKVCYFKKEDILNLKYKDKLRYKDGVINSYNKNNEIYEKLPVKILKFGNYKIGCTIITIAQMNYIKSRFKNMK